MSQIAVIGGGGGGGAGTVVSLTGNAGGAVGPNVGGNINVVGGTGVSVVGTPGTNTLTLNNTGINQDNIIYVGKHGNDANSGLSIEEAKLTFGSAITAAFAIAPAAVVCFDSGTYVENLTGQTGVDIFAPNATLQGASTIVSGEHWVFDVLSVLTGTTGILLNAPGGFARVTLNEVTCAGTGIGFVCLNGNAIISMKLVLIANGQLIGILTAGEVNFSFQDIEISGTGAVISMAASAQVYATGNAILDQGSGTLFYSTSIGIVPHVAMICSGVVIHNLSNITATPICRLTAGYMSGALLQIGAGSVNAVDGTTRMDGVPIGAQIPSTGSFTNLTSTNFTHTDGVNYFDGTAMQTTTVGTAGQVLTSNGSGNAPTFQGLPAPSTYFQAYLSTSTDFVANAFSTPVVFDVAITNVGSAYNTSTGVFTAPATGFYSFSITLFFININHLSGNVDCLTMLTGSAVSFRVGQTITNGTTAGAGLTTAFNLHMSIGDTIKVVPFADGTGNYTVFGAAPSSTPASILSMFSGYKIA